MTKFVWDNIEFWLTSQEADLSEVGWELTRTYPNGVKRFEDDRGHVGLEVEARDHWEANELFAHYCPEYAEEMRGQMDDADQKYERR